LASEAKRSKLDSVPEADESAEPAAEVSNEA